MSDWNAKVIAEFRANDGKVGGNFEGSDLLLLHTTGAKSGLQRITPLMMMQDGSRYVVIASKGGAPTHPDWYYNIKANQGVTIEVGADTLNGKAYIADEPERTALYDEMANRYAFFVKYREDTKGIRTIPVIVIEPAG